MTLKKIFINRNAKANVLSGHPWCYLNSIEKVENGIKDGDLCEIFSGNNFLGIGYHNSKPDIRIRIITRRKLEINTDFFIERFNILRKNKETYLTNTNAYRLVFGESDNLPGLIVDVYNKTLIIQIHTLGMEKLKSFIVEALVKIYSPSMIFERSDVGSRTNEGMPNDTKGLLYGKEVTDVEIIENGYKFVVNVIEGQKTGFFIDQRENRLALTKYCKDKKVLNCFSYTGGFSVYAAKTADSVTSVDISKPATEQARTNFKINNYDLTKHKFEAVDVFDYLKALSKGDFDLIILDPPSFAKNKKQIPNAVKAYTTINSKALEKLNDYDILVTSSCTTNIDEHTFLKILAQSSQNANCYLKILESKTQPVDHTYNLSFPEGRYLKFFVCQKIPIQ
jgi:23S rRNA (cytosine1962-C5)-methyltransferase